MPKIWETMPPLSRKPLVAVAISRRKRPGNCSSSIRVCSAPSGFDLFLRESWLGNYLVWATFNPDDPRADPFARLPSTHQGIRTALGLGHCTPSDTLIVLVWNHADSGSPPLHRPTVADTEVLSILSAPTGRRRPLGFDRTAAAQS